MILPIVLPSTILQSYFIPYVYLLCLGVSIADDFLAAGGSAASSYGSSRTRMLEFSVQHEDRIIHLKVCFYCFKHKYL